MMKKIIMRLQNDDLDELLKESSDVDERIRKVIKEIVQNDANVLAI